MSSQAGNRLEARRLTCFPVVMALLMVASVASGCQYASRRGHDLAEVFSLGLSDGGGVLARVVPTRFLTLEVGARKDETFIGFRKGRFNWVESSYAIPMSFFWSPRLGLEPYENWVWLDVIKTSHSKLLYPPADQVGEPKGVYEERKYHLFVLTSSENTRAIDSFDVEVELSALFGGLHVGLSLGEFFDFFAGLVGLDPAGDDLTRGKEKGGDPRQGELEAEDAVEPDESLKA